MKHAWSGIKRYGLWEAHPSAVLQDVFWKGSQLDRRIHFHYFNDKIACAFLQSLLANIWPLLTTNLCSCYELHLSVLPSPVEKCGNLVIQYKNKAFQLIHISKTLRTWIRNVLEEVDQKYFTQHSPTVFCYLTPSYLCMVNGFCIR